MSFKGKKHSKETKRKMSERMMGNPSKTGQIDSIETRKNKSIAQLGEKHHSWSGDNPTYEALHRWAKRHKSKTDCEFCGSNRFIELSNISGKYKRDLNDWQYLCSKCD